MQSNSAKLLFPASSPALLHRRRRRKKYRHPSILHRSSALQQTLFFLHLATTPDWQSANAAYEWISSSHLRLPVGKVQRPTNCCRHSPTPPSLQSAIHPAPSRTHIYKYPPAKFVAAFRSPHPPPPAVAQKMHPLSL